MKNDNRLNVGIDVSKDSLDMAFWEQDEAVYKGKFPNTRKGFNAITRKIQRKCKETDTSHVAIVMEPTGGYEQPFARFAIQQEWHVSLPNPYQIKRWAEATGIRAKTDRRDSKTLAHYGFMQEPPDWKPSPPEVEQLEHLLDRLDDLKAALNREKSRYQVSKFRANKHDAGLASLEDSIAFLEQQIQKVEEAIKEHLKAHPHLRNQKKLLMTVSGVGEKNVLYLLVVLHRWNAFTDGKGKASSLAAYAGLDPKPCESGTSIRKRKGISRQGNRLFRARLFMSALGGINGKNSPLTNFYKGLVGRGKAKKLALVAAARKILIWSWSVFKTNTPFDVTRFGITQ